MKKLLIALLLSFSTQVGANAQSDTTLQGTVRYLLTHNWTKKMAAVDYLSTQQRERVAYMWGNRAEWKEYTLLHFSPLASRYEESEERAEADDVGYSWRKEPLSLRRDFDKNTLSDYITQNGKTYHIEDTLLLPKWKIHNDLKEVAGHVCMRATWEDTIKHQKVVAWFAQDIPVSAGPERLCGLPGLILEVDLNNGGMIITADRITLHRIGKELDHPKKIKGKKVKEAQYMQALRQHMKDRREAEEPYFWGMRY